MKLNFRKIILCGYSMGGRAALSYYSNYPEKVKGLILESSTPGIEETRLRNERIESDMLLVRKIESEGIKEFGNYWLNLPMFESLKSIPEEEYRKVLNAKIKNNPIGLINSLKGFGTGSMPVLWDRITDIRFPLLLITGEYDSKFTGINEKINRKISGSEHIIIKDCGHNTHLEKPAEFINLVNRYLSDNFLTDMK